MPYRGFHQNTIGVGLIGYSIGRAHTHAWLNMPLYYYPPPARPTLAAVAGRNQERLRDFAKKYGYSKTYSRIEDLVKDKEVDLVDICTPPGTHAEIAVTACEAGKHVLCEKPLARTADEAKEMLRVAEKAGVKHMAAFNYRFMPSIGFAKKLIEEGYIGRPFNFRGAYLNIEVGDRGYVNPEAPLDWHFRKETAGYGALSDLGSHILDLARFLVGEIKSVAGATATYVDQRPLSGSPNEKGRVEVDDSTVAAIKFANGALGTIEASWMAPGRKDFLRFEILGSEGSLRFNLERLNELEIFSLRDPNELRGFRDVWTIAKAHPYMDKFWFEQGGGFGWDHAFVNEVHHFTDCIVNDKKVEPTGASFLDGIRNCSVMDAIVESAKTERWVQVEN